jgi:hypothetical protein
MPHDEQRPQPGSPESAADAAGSEPTRPDPRDRPADPAGTQPKVDPESLLPARRPGDAIDRGAAPPPGPGEPPDVRAGGDAGREGELVTEATAIELDPDESSHLLPEVRDPATGHDAAVGPVAAAEVPHAPRFQFLLGAMLALGAAAIAAAVLLVAGGGSSSSPGPSWSTWRPTGGGVDPVAQIAEHVGGEYHLPTGEQLVAVTGGPMQVAGLPLTIALRHPPSEGGVISLIEGKGVLYRLCGLGEKCSIAKGKASTSRHLLLRREALELALYTFRYVKDLDEVVVFMPPRKGQDPSQALFFRRGDLNSELGRPLDRSLATRTPSVKDVAAAPDAPLVNTITTRSLFKFSLTQANQDNRAFLVLDTFSATGR